MGEPVFWALIAVVVAILYASSSITAQIRYTATYLLEEQKRQAEETICVELGAIQREAELIRMEVQEIARDVSPPFMAADD